jgi:hypothetical protein
MDFGMMRFVRVGIAVGAVLLAGCGDQVPTQPITPQGAGTIVSTSAGAPQYLGPITAPRNYPGTGITISPPPAGAAARLDWSTIYPANCKTTWACSSGSPAVEAASYSNSLNSTVPQNTLVWVFTWHNVTCQNFGPPKPPNYTPPPEILLGCNWTIFADANSGKDLLTVVAPP